MNPPNAFILGAPRCATTWLHRSLLTGSNVAASTVHKEPFALMHMLGDERFPARCTVDEYLRSFPDEEVRLDSSPNNFVNPSVATLINRWDGRAVIILRDPAERARSHWAYSKNNGIEHATMQDAFQNDAHRWRHNPVHAYLTLSHYERFIPPLAKRLGERLMVVRFEHLTTREEVFHRVADHLGVRDAHPIPKTINPHQHALHGPGRPLGGFLENTLRIPRRWLDQLDRLRHVGTTHDNDIPSWVYDELDDTYAWLETSEVIA